MNERKAAEGPVNWNGIAATPEFRALLRAKARFIVPATLFFVVYYFALPVLVGYAPAWMGQRMLGPLNRAYLFALSQFVMAWVLAALYVRRAARFDQMAAKILEKLERRNGN